MADLAFAGLLIAGGVAVLFYGADWLVRGSARLASALGVPPIVVGLTVVSFGTSAPELVVCVLAALRGSPDLAIGNVLGSNLANVGLILGLAALIRPLQVHARVVWREAPLMVLATAALFPMFLDRTMGRLDGGLLLASLVAYMIFLLRTARSEPAAVDAEFEEFVEASTGSSATVRNADLALIGAGLVCLAVGGFFIVEGALLFATGLGVSEVAIGLTVVAVGTSLPELATSLVASMRRESDIAVGNVIGSNIFNVAAILGITALIRPVSIGPTVLSRELPATLLLSLLLVPVLRSGWQIRRWEGALLLAAYLGITIFLV